MKTNIIIILLAVCICSCSKANEDDEESSIITARVIDFDLRTPIAGAKVYIGKQPLPLPADIFRPDDSAISAADGKVSFSIQNGIINKMFVVEKTGYEYIYTFPATDSAYPNASRLLFLGKPSFVNLTIHSTGVYLPLDSVLIKQIGSYNSLIYPPKTTNVISYDRANAPDKVFNLKTFFWAPDYTKLYFECDLIRNGNIISTKIDSADIIQYSTKNYTLNY